MDYRTLGKWGYLAGSVLFLTIGLSYGIPSAFDDATGLFTAPFSYVAAFGSAVAFGFLALVSIAWILAGRGLRSGLFSATGAVGLALVGISAVMYLFFVLVPMEATSNPRAFLPSFLGIFVFVLLFAVFGLAFLVLEIVSHFVAAELLKVGAFRYAGYSRIITYAGGLVGLVGVSVALVASEFANGFPGTSGAGTGPDVFLRWLGIAIGVIYCVLSVNPFLSYVAFKRSLSGPLPSADSIAPPPPPPALIGSEQSSTVG